MALTTPTIKEIQGNIISAIEAETGQTVPIFAKTVFRILSYALAGVWIILYKYGSDQFNQRFVQTALDFYLEIHGELVKITRQPATTWDGEADVESTTTGTLPPNTQLVNNNTGVVYLTTESTTLFVGTVTFKLAATEGGEIGNLNISDVINFVSPLPGLEDFATVSSIISAGEDEEDIEIYRQRVLDAYQKKPQGGALADYEQWAEEAPNVINAYPYAGSNPSEVDIYIEVDNQTDGIPTSSQLTATLAYINYDPITGKATRRPVNAIVNVLAISRSTYDVEIIGLSPDTPDIRDDIDDALTDLFLQKENYIQGLAIQRNDIVSRSETLALVQQIAADAGSALSNVIVKKSGTIIDLDVLDPGEKAKLGVITYV